MSSEKLSLSLPRFETKKKSKLFKCEQKVKFDLQKLWSKIKNLNCHIILIYLRLSKRLDCVQKRASAEANQNLVATLVHRKKTYEIHILLLDTKYMRRHIKKKLTLTGVVEKKSQRAQ